MRKSLSGRTSNGNFCQNIRLVLTVDNTKRSVFHCKCCHMGSSSREKTSENVCQKIQLLPTVGEKKCFVVHCKHYHMKISSRQQIQEKLFVKSSASTYSGRDRIFRGSLSALPYETQSGTKFKLNFLTKISASNFCLR